MKKIFFSLLTLCLCGATWADDFVVDGIHYNITSEEGAENPTVEVTFEGTSHSFGTATTTYVGDIVIPESVSYRAEEEDEATTYAVIGIGQYAFRDNHNMTSLTIPNSIQYIDSQGCAYMGGAGPDTSSTTVGDYYMIVTIEGGADASALEIKMGTNNLYTFSRSYIDTLYVNRDIVLEEGGNIQYAPFHDNSYLKTAVFGDGVTNIIDYFFDGCTILSSISLPEGLESIGTYAFYNTAIEKIVIPSTVTTFGASIFENCSSLHTVILTAQDPTNETPTYGDFSKDSDITFYVPRGCAAAYYASLWQTNVVGQHDDFSFNFYNLTTIREDSGDGEDNGDGTVTYYATYYYDGDGEGDYTYEIDDTSKKLYAVTGVKDGEVVKEQLNGDIIPKNTPLLIESSTPGAYYMWRNYYETDDEGKSTPFYSDEPKEISLEGIDNMLYGHSEAGDTSVNGVTNGYKFYKLSLDPDATKYSIGFYYGAVGGVSYEAGAHRCWLAVPTDTANGADVISIKKSNEGDTTGISSIESASEAKVSGIYTIQGVRVSNMNQPGLYIVDGKKVLVK